MDDRTTRAVALLFCCAALAGCARDDAGAVLLRTLENTARAACDWAPSCSTAQMGNR